MNLGGIYAPIATPFNQREELALGDLEQNLALWVDSPLDGVLMPGSNSEAAYLSRSEKKELWRTCSRVLSKSGTQFIGGTGAESTRETVELTMAAAELGADAALVIPPHFYRAAMNPARLMAFYRTVADESPIPVMIYNVPAFAVIDLDFDIVAELAEHPNIVGLKDSSSNVVKTARLLAACPQFRVFAGTGSALLPFLCLGAVGGIMALANFASRRLRELMDAFTAGQMLEAKQIQLSLAEINTAVTARFGVPGLKHAMQSTGYHGGPCRAPLTALSQSQRAEIDRLLAQAGLLEPSP